MLLVGSALLCNRYKNRYRSDWNTFLNQQHLDKWLFLLFSIDQLIDYHQKTSIAIPENNAKNSAPQSVNYCVTDFRRTPVRLQICSLQFALCSTAFCIIFGSCYSWCEGALNMYLNGKSPQNMSFEERMELTASGNKDWQYLQAALIMAERNKGNNS